MCGNAGLGNDGNEYKIITEIFLYKFLNDKFAHEAKLNRAYGERLSQAEKWDAEYDTFTEDEVEDLWSYMGHNIPRLKPEHTLGHLYNASTQSGFGDLLDGTLLDIANANAEIFSMASVGETKITIFERITTTHGIPDICIKQNTMPSVWWDECCGHLFNGNPRALYEKGRRAMMKKLRRPLLMSYMTS